MNEPSSEMIVSDDFADTSLDQGLWQTVISAEGSGVRVVDTGSGEAFLEMAILPGLNADLFTTNEDATRVLQNTADEDFTVELKYLSAPSKSIQFQGTSIVQDSNNQIRFDTFYINGETRAFVAVEQDGVWNTRFQVPIPPETQAFLRVERTDDTFTFQHSADGDVWLNIGSIEQELVVSQIGPHAGVVAPSGGAESNSPGFVAELDYFFNTVAPIIDEDAGAANLPPVAAPDFFDAPEDNSITFDPASNDVDPEETSLTVVAVSDAVNGSAVLNADGTVTYIPNVDFNGADSFTYEVEDAQGAVSSGTVSISIAAVNDAPTAVGFVADRAVDQNGMATIYLQGLFRDIDNDVLTLQVEGPDWLTVEGMTLVASPTGANLGAVDVTVRAFDGQAAGEAHSFSITVVDSVDEPVFEPIDFANPGDARILDVTDLPQELLDLNPGIQNAIANDGIDDTAAIQAALNFSPNGFRIVYLPEGEYNISETLVWGTTETIPGLPQNLGGRRVTLRGESEEDTIIRLDDGVFTDENPGAVIETGQLNSSGAGTTFSFFNEVRDLTVHTGDNAGATGIRSNTNNGGGVQDVTIIDGTSDGSGDIGLSAGFTSNIGPQLIQNVEINGFGVGISVASNEFGATLENISLRNQTEVGIQNVFNAITIRNLDSEQENDITVVTSPQFAGLTNVTDSTFSYSGSNIAQNSAFLFNDNNTGGSNQFLRDVALVGYETAIDFIDFRNDGTPDAITGTYIDEFVSSEVLTLFEDTSTESLNLDVPDTPDIALDPDFRNWANVEDFGAIAGDGIDDTAAFQAAINSGASTVYLPSRSLDVDSNGIAIGGGEYSIDSTLFVTADIERVIGLRSQIGGNGEVAFVDGSASAVIWEGIAVNSFTSTGLGTLSFSVDTSRDVIIASGNLAPAGLFANGPGNLFLEDVVGGPIFVNGSNLYASQLDNEFAGTKIVNDGGVVVINGLKTEQRGTVIETINGGQTELLGGLIVSSQDDIADGITPAFFVEDSDFSASFRENQNGSFTPYSIGIREVRDGEIREFQGSAAFGTSAALYVSRGRVEPDVERVIVNGDEGNDRLSVRGQSDSHLIDGLGGNDVLRGGDADDIVRGGNGNDRLFGDLGADQLFGGAGNDLLYVDADDQLIDGGDGYDRVIVQDDHHFEIDLATSAVERVDSGLGDDILNASDMVERVDLRSGGGSDTLLGGAANDALRAGAGDDVLSGGGGNDRLIGEDGADVLSGGEGNDILHGGAGGDLLRGGEGNDRLYGDGGIDRLIAGAGDDLLFVDVEDTLINGGDGFDRVIVQDERGFEINFAESAVERVDSSIGNDFLDASGMTSRTDLRSGGGDDTLFGGTANDALLAGDGDDFLVGGAGNDRLIGGTGLDVLDGGQGNDILRGGDDDDFLRGGDGSDQLFGDTGSDTFVFDSNDGTNMIRDFEFGVDIIFIDTSSGSFDDLEIVMAGSETRISFESTVLRFGNTDDGQFSEVNFEFGELVGSLPSVSDLLF